MRETDWLCIGGEAGDEGAVLELDDVLLEEIFGVVVEELPELATELESEVISDCVTGALWWTFCVFTIVRLWSVGMRGVVSSVVGVGGASLDGPG